MSLLSRPRFILIIDFFNVHTDPAVEILSYHIFHEVANPLRFKLDSSDIFDEEWGFGQRRIPTEMRRGQG